jgi:hypothetical protein
MASKEKNSSKFNFLNWILVIAIGLFLGLLVLYFFNIFDLDTTKKADWGTFGDFIGGTLNPLFALFSLFAIIYTIKIQTEELELSREELESTRKELEGSRIAQQEQSESLKLQNEATKLQIFENTFFQLLNLFINTRNNLTLDVIENDYYRKIGLSSKNYPYYKINGIEEEIEKEIEYKEYEGNNEVFNLYLIILNKYELIYDKFNNMYEKFTGIYFGQIYQILKFINDNNTTLCSSCTKKKADFMGFVA